MKDIACLCGLYGRWNSGKNCIHSKEHQHFHCQEVYSLQENDL